MPGSLGTPNQLPQHEMFLQTGRFKLETWQDLCLLGKEQEGMSNVEGLFCTLTPSKSQEPAAGWIRAHLLPPWHEVGLLVPLAHWVTVPIPAGCDWGLEVKYMQKRLFPADRGQPYMHSCLGDVGGVLVEFKRTCKSSAWYSWRVGDSHPSFWHPSL